MTKREEILKALADGKPKASREIILLTGISENTADNVLRSCWREGLLLRTDKPIRQRTKVFKGRGGMKLTLRNFYLYMLRPKNADRLSYHGRTFVKFEPKYLDIRGRKGRKTKASMILDFLKEHRNEAFYSADVVEALKDQGIKPDNVSLNIRRFEKRGLVYVRGYRSGDRETPFERGYIVTYLDQEKDRKEAIEEAVGRTDKLLLNKMSKSPFIERIQRIRDIIISSTKVKELASQEFLLSKLGCAEHELKYAIKRGLQLYPDLKVVKLFDLFPHFYHSSMDEKDLNMLVELKKNYIRKVGGRRARVGHNWEGVVGWFIDEFTDAEFMTQKHRTKMDERRITIHLVKPVAGRRHNAEVDRVWKITPSIFSNPITYILEAKHGVVMKKHLDGFLSILKNSKEFGCDTEKGRELKAGIIPVFAGGTFNPREKIYLENGAVDLITYASRMNIQLLRASDFNEKLTERGISIKECSVQKICKYCSDEREVRQVLTEIWKKPKRAGEILQKVIQKNRKIYELEKMLEED